jgi:DNA sulfur modification protein DndE
MRTGLTPNILARMALCYSLESGTVTNLVPTDEDGQEFNRFTLTGEYDVYFVSLIKERCIKDNLDPDKDFMKTFKAHINNGVLAIHGRLKDLSDLPNLLAK